MGVVSGSEEMLKMAEPYFVLPKPPGRESAGTSSNSANAVGREVVVSQFTSLFSASTDSLVDSDWSHWGSGLPHSIPASRQPFCNASLLSRKIKSY